MDVTEHKKTFQLERMILFSDAVFAIAITLLAIELKFPEIENATNAELTEELLHVLPHFLSFFLSFVIIGIYWIAHHRLFYYAINYDTRLIWLNLFFLFFIALMPFTSSIYGFYNLLNTSFLLYTGNIVMLALFNYLLFSRISNPAKKLSHGLENRRLVTYYKLRSWVTPCCFGIGILITLLFEGHWAIMASRMSPFLIFPGMRLLRKRYADVLAN